MASFLMSQAVVSLYITVLFKIRRPGEISGLYKSIYVLDLEQKVSHGTDYLEPIQLEGWMTNIQS